MPQTATTYVKSLEDELDWKLLDQLHAAVSQISGFCFETKKFCVTTQLIVVTFLLNFTKSKLDHSLFVAGTAVPVCFWFLDSVAYYYQVKIRGMMEAIRKRIQERNRDAIQTTGGTAIIAIERIDKSKWRLISAAAFNHSMWLYYLLTTVALLLWVLYTKGVFA